MPGDVNGDVQVAWRCERWCAVAEGVNVGVQVADGVEGDVRGGVIEGVSGGVWRRVRGARGAPIRSSSGSNGGNW